MKTLKITLALAAVLMLTVSGVNSEEITSKVTENNEITKSSKIDLLAHTKKTLKKPTRS